MQIVEKKKQAKKAFLGTFENFWPKKLSFFAPPR